jgi:hypothetical protein
MCEMFLRCFEIAPRLFLCLDTDTFFFGTARVMSAGEGCGLKMVSQIIRPPKEALGISGRTPTPRLGAAFGTARKIDPLRNIIRKMKIEIEFHSCFRLIPSGRKKGTKEL